MLVFFVFPGFILFLLLFLFFLLDLFADKFKIIFCVHITRVEFKSLLVGSNGFFQLAHSKKSISHIVGRLLYQGRVRLFIDGTGIILERLIEFPLFVATVAQVVGNFRVVRFFFTRLKEFLARFVECLFAVQFHSFHSFSIRRRSCGNSWKKKYSKGENIAFEQIHIRNDTKN